MDTNHHRALAALSLSLLLASLGTSIANVGLPALADAFTASFHELQWIVLAYLLPITALVVFAGRLGDRIGRRRLLLGGILLFTAASSLCALAPTLGLLIAARAAQGAGAAIMMALAMALVGETVPKARFGSAMGLLGTMSAVGTALGPSLGGMLIALGGWRAMFLVSVPLGLATLLLAYRALPAPAAVTKATALPLPGLGMLRDPVLAAGVAMSALVSTVVMATLIVGPFYLARGLELEVALVGFAMSAGPFVAALGGIPAGRAVDRFGAHRMVIAGLALMALGSTGLALVPAALGPAGYVAPIAIVTAGYALFQAANNTAVMIDVRPDRRGTTSGMLNLSRNIGLVAGASVMGAIFALASGGGDLAAARPDAIAAGMHVTFAVAASLVLAALAIALASRSSHPTA